MRRYRGIKTMGMVEGAVVRQARSRTDSAVVRIPGVNVVEAVVTASSRPLFELIGSRELSDTGSTCSALESSSSSSSSSSSRSSCRRLGCPSSTNRPQYLFGLHTRSLHTSREERILVPTTFRCRCFCCGVFFGHYKVRVMSLGTRSN